MLFKKAVINNEKTIKMGGDKIVDCFVACLCLNGSCEVEFILFKLIFVEFYVMAAA